MVNMENSTKSAVFLFRLGWFSVVLRSCRFSDALWPVIHRMKIYSTSVLSHFLTKNVVIIFHVSDIVCYGMHSWTKFTKKKTEIFLIFRIDIMRKILYYINRSKELRTNERHERRNEQ